MCGKHEIRVMVVALVAVTLAGCQTVPETSIERPLSARPVVKPKPALAQYNGAIFQANTGMSLFEDRRARDVGDIITVTLVEKTEVKRKSETKDERTANANLSVPSPTLLGKAGLFGASAWAPNSSSAQEFKDDESNTNSVSGSIAVTVVEVLANGNLAVAGEKQVAVNNDTEYLRLAGVVNPRDIGRDGTVKSTQLADVRIESKNAQSLDKAQLTSMMARFFLTMLPF